jgi:SAM-dependent methyltransferase
MRIRVSLGSFMIRLGGFIQSLALMVMKPDDLVEFSRQRYAQPKQLTYWTSENMVERGLNLLEDAFLAKVPFKTGRLLLLYVGGGRDAIPLAQLGFNVTGIDFLPEMVQQAQENAARHGVHLEGEVQDVTNLILPEQTYDLIWIANSMYSAVPWRATRVEMLRRLHRALKPGGYFFCSFYWEERPETSPRAELARKIFAFLTMGNLWYEPGDKIWPNGEFLHTFVSEAELQSEFADGGFTTLHLQIPKSETEGGALLVPGG